MTDAPTPLVPRDARRAPWRVLDPGMHAVLYVEAQPDAPTLLRALADALEQYDPGPGHVIDPECCDIRVHDDVEGWTAVAVLVIVPEPPRAATP